MGLHKKPYDEQNIFADIPIEDQDDLEHKQKVRRMIEEKLERKRLQKEELDEWDEDEFDWSDKK